MGRPIRCHPRPLCIILLLFEGRDVDQAHHEGFGSPGLGLTIPFARPQQLIDKARAIPAHQQIFKALQAAEVKLELGVTPACRFPDLAPRKAQIAGMYPRAPTCPRTRCSRRRVWGGSSSSVVPSTAWANVLAAAMSSRLASI